MEKDFKETLERLRALSKANPKTLEQIALKLTEETGEVAQALLAMQKTNGSAYKELSQEDLVEELLDTTMTALSMVFKLGKSDAYLLSTFNAKLDKWQEKSGIKLEEPTHQPKQYVNIELVEISSRRILLYIVSGFRAFSWSGVEGDEFFDGKFTLTNCRTVVTPSGFFLPEVHFRDNETDRFYKVSLGSNITIELRD